ncbi:transposase [Gudongella sp. DL1XJH-153]|uniref:transposase n=1 Tax=Gudongella sp. DL1XJH-153 TaxID=3409804 RepID=UPI003BB733D0
MIIRQDCLFSYDELMEISPKTRLMMILDQIDVSPLALAMEKTPGTRGPKGYPKERLIYSLLAKEVEQILKISSLVRRLESDPSFKYACGFGIMDKTPSESVFSRFQDALSEEPALVELFQNLVVSAMKSGIIDGSEIAIDSTKLSSYEASQPKKDIVNDGNHPNWGMKRDTNGNNIRWFGWKLHILCDAKSELPLSIKVTPASVHDGSVASDMIKDFLDSYAGLFKPSHYLMDSGYDYDYLYREIVDTYDATPIIAYNPRGSKAPPEGLNESLHPVCSAGYELKYWGKDASYMKFRCPHMTGDVDCPFGSNWCSTSNYGLTLKLNYRKNPRIHGYPLRDSKAWKKLYNKRTSVERLNARLKENLNVDGIRSNGIKKALMHCLLNCIALVAGTIAINKKS